MNKFLLSCLLVSIAVGTSYAQERIITGKVISSEDGSDLPGVSVLLKGTRDGVVTDANGNYKINNSSDGGVLVFSFIGLATQEVVVGGRTVVDVTMTPDLLTLDEIVVTALGIKREEQSLGYAVQKISSEGMEQARETNFVNSLTGKIAGVQVTGASGNIGGSSRITMRGINSISGNNQPLFVVDGTPLDNSNFNSDLTTKAQGGKDFGNTIQDINPDDIESISVLKGANAAALYGNRASNGVILITTKQGTSGKGISGSWNSTFTLEKAYILPDYQNEYGGGYSQEFNTLSNGELVADVSADESWGPKLDGQLVRQWYSFYPEATEYFGKATPWVARPDNIKDFYETGRTRSNNISVQGGNDQSSFRLSYTNVDQKGIVPYSSLKRNVISVNAETTINTKLKAGARINFVNASVVGRPPTGGWNPDQVTGLSFNTWFQRQLDLGMMKNYRTSTGRIMNWNLSSPDNLDPYYWNNDYFVLAECYSNDTRNRLYGNVYLTYDVNPNLKVTGYARKDLYNYTIEDRLAEGFIYQTMYEKSFHQFDESNYELLAQYTKDLSSDFSLFVNAGANTRRTNTDFTYGKTQGGLSSPNYFNLNASADRPIVDDAKTELVVNSLYGSVNFGYKDVVFVEVTNRADWSSSLPLNDNVYYFPSVSTSFVFSEVAEKDWLSFGKLRVSLARVGNGTLPYRLKNTFAAERPYGTQPVFTVPNELNNANLRPERTTSFETGLDARLFGGRVNLDITYYNKISTDQIIPVTVSATSGYDKAIINAGKVTNRGIELTLSGRPLQLASGLTWDVGFNLARNQNKVVALAEGLDNYVLGYTFVNSVGMVNSVNAMVEKPYGTIITNGYKYNEKGEKLVDENGYYIVEQNKAVGSILPDFTGGITNTISFKRFSLSALIDYQKGGHLFSHTMETGLFSGLLTETVGVNDKGIPKRNPVSEGGGVRADGVTESGEMNDIYIEAADYYKAFSNNIKENHVFDASFVKFRELRVGYCFSKACVSIVARNLAVIYKAVPHIDPEAALGSDNFQGLEDSQVPSTRSIGFNFNAKF